MVRVGIKCKNEKVIPKQQTSGSVGFDLFANIENNVTIVPGKWALIPTGVHLELPPFHEAQIRSRSGLAAKHGVFVLNSPGTIDWDYRGEIKVILANFGSHEFVVKPYTRIAQMVITSLPRVKLELVDKLTETERNSNGFGSTGL